MQSCSTTGFAIARPCPTPRSRSSTRPGISRTCCATTASRTDLDEFVACYNPANRHERKATWCGEETPPPSPLPQGEGEVGPCGRWRAFDYEELLKRDKLNLDIFWLRDQSLEDSENLPEPDVLAREIADDLQTALDQFSAIAAELRREG
jgi:type I restriction enzyme M protein